jgi:adenylate cyclase
MKAPAGVRAGGLVPTLLVALLALTRPSLLAPLELAAYDLVLRAAPAPPPGGRVVIVDVDERSLSEVGQWPWRRDLVGALVERLRSHGAAIVALDIIFAEPDRFEGAEVSPDETLAQALRPGRVVLGYGMTFEGDGEAWRDGCPQHPLGLAVVGGSDEPAERPYFRATAAICSLPALAAAAGRSGFLNAAPDRDGRLRRAPLLIELDGQVYPAIALAAVTAMTGASESALHVRNVNASSLRLSRPRRASGAGDAAAIAAVPLDGKANLLLRYRGPKRTFPYVSASDVLHGRIEPAAIRDKLVLVGTTALGTREVVSTPLDTLFTGVEVQATIADNLLTGDFLARPANAPAIEALVVAVLGLAATMLAAGRGLPASAAAATAGAAAAWAGSAGLLSATGTFVSPLYPCIGGVAALGSLLVVGFVSERGRAERAGEAHASSQRLMVQTLLSLTEMKDAETGRHSRRTQQYARVLAQELARCDRYRDYLTAERIELLATLAPLHDIGKVGVPDHVLNKPGALTPEELVEMRKHPVHGRDVILQAQREAGVRDDLTLSIAKDIVYTHHEKWDGTGYPEGLQGDAIPIPGRIMAVVDVYDACTTRRLYTPSLSQDEAVALIVKGRGTHFDPDVVDAFLNVVPVMRGLAEAHA